MNIFSVLLPEVQQKKKSLVVRDEIISVLFFKGNRVKFMVSGRTHRKDVYAKKAKESYIHLVEKWEEVGGTYILKRKEQKCYCL